MDDHAMIYGHFGDDDLSLRIRRAGYKLIYTEDTFVHHYGSATYSKIGQDKMALMEEYMVRKHGFTTWGQNLPEHNGFNILAEQDMSGKRAANILCIGDNLGAMGLHLKRALQIKGCQLSLYGGLFSELYRPYVEASYEKTTIWTADGLTGIAEGTMDLVVIPHLEELGANYLVILQSLQKMLKPGGRIYFGIYNRSSCTNILSMINEQYRLETVASLNNRNALMCSFDCEQLFRQLKHAGWWLNHQLKITEDVDKNYLGALHKTLDLSKRYSQKEWETMLKTRQIVVSISMD